MDQRPRSDLWLGSVHSDQIQLIMLSFGRAVRQRVPEILITISVAGLAYRLYSAWVH